MYSVPGCCCSMFCVFFHIPLICTQVKKRVEKVFWHLQTVNHSKRSAICHESYIEKRVSGNSAGDLFGMVKTWPKIKGCWWPRKLAHPYIPWKKKYSWKMTFNFLFPIDPVILLMEEIPNQPPGIVLKPCKSCEIYQPQLIFSRISESSSHTSWGFGAFLVYGFWGVPATPPARWAWWHRQLGVVDVFWGHLFFLWAGMKEKMRSTLLWYITL